MKKLLLILALILLPQFAYADITTGLVGWWKFDEGSGTNAADSGSGGNAGTLTNSPTWVSGKIGNSAISFDGVNDYVDIGNPSALQIIGQISLSAWVNVDVFGDGSNGCAGFCSAIIEKGFSGGKEAYVLRIQYPTARLTHELAVLSYDGTDNGTYWAKTGWNTGVWHHVVGVYNGTNWILYFDGENVAQTSDGTGAISSGVAVTIGAAIINGSPVRYFDGSIDDVRIYNRALSSTDVAELYAYPTVTTSIPRMIINFGRWIINQGRLLIN